MIRIATQPDHETSPAWHAGFLGLLPTIIRHARIAFRDLKPEARHDAVGEVVANTMVAYARLVELGKARLAYPSPLARYGIAQVRDGRRVGSRHSIRDVLSRYAQRSKGFSVERLDKYDGESGWLDIVVEDRNAGPAEVAATRIDFSDWLERLPKRQRRIATRLAVGERPVQVGKQLGLTHARISQIRGELHQSWQEFQGQEADEEAVEMAAIA